MKTLKNFSLFFTAFAFIMGCSGTSGKLKTLSESDSKVTQRELIENWPDYDIRYREAVLVFAPKNNDRKILLGGKRGWWWRTIGDQETWTKFAKANITSQGEFSPVWTDYSMSPVREIRGPDNQLYGYIIHQRMDIVNTRLIDKNTMRLWVSQARVGGPVK